MALRRMVGELFVKITADNSAVDAKLSETERKVIDSGNRIDRITGGGGGGGAGALRGMVGFIDFVAVASKAVEGMANQMRIMTSALDVAGKAFHGDMEGAGRAATRIVDDLAKIPVVGQLVDPLRSIVSAAVAPFGLQTGHDIATQEMRAAIQEEIAIRRQLRQAILDGNQGLVKEIELGIKLESMRKGALQTAESFDDSLTDVIKNLSETNISVLKNRKFAADEVRKLRILDEQEIERLRATGDRQAVAEEQIRQRIERRKKRASTPRELEELDKLLELLIRNISIAPEALSRQLSVDTAIGAFKFGQDLEKRIEVNTKDTADNTQQVASNTRETNAVLRNMLT